MIDQSKDKTILLNGGEVRLIRELIVLRAFEIDAFSNYLNFSFNNSKDMICISFDV